LPLAKITDEKNRQHAADEPNGRFASTSSRWLALRKTIASSKMIPAVAASEVQEQFRLRLLLFLRRAAELRIDARRKFHLRCNLFFARPLRTTQRRAPPDCR